MIPLYSFHFPCVTLCSIILRLSLVFRLMFTPCVLIKSCSEQIRRLVNQSWVARLRAQDLPCRPFPDSETHPIARSISFPKIFANLASNCQTGLFSRQSSLVEQFLCFTDQSVSLLSLCVQLKIGEFSRV